MFVYTFQFSLTIQINITSYIIIVNYQLYIILYKYIHNHKLNYYIKCKKHLGGLYNIKFKGLAHQAPSSLPFMPIQ